jgi:hypothetical protein
MYRSPQLGKIFGTVAVSIDIQEAGLFLISDLNLLWAQNNMMNILNKMLDRTINAAGEWNAQLFRELKGRLNPKNFTLTLLGSVAGQALLMMTFFIRLPINPQKGALDYSPNREYCVLANSGCQLDDLNHVIINWPHWWTDILVAISWVISTVLVVGGLYFLVNDLRREETRGTLNFVRLSPQSAANIFMGKLLGVPILIYVAVASILPLQILAGSSGFGLVNTLVFDGLWLTIAALFYLGAMLLVTITPVMPIGITLLAWWLQSTVGMLMQYTLSVTKSRDLLSQPATSDAPTWFYLPVFGSITSAMLFAIFSCGLIAYAMWLMLCRRYLNPNDTLISKKQSYQFNTVLQVWLMGWALPLSLSTPHITNDILTAVSSVQFIFAFILISTIIPRRNVLQEWCRQTDLRLPKGLPRWWPNLIWDDRSPAVVALVINLIMAETVWVLFGFMRSASPAILPVAGLMLLILLNCGIAVQISAAHKLPRYLNGSMVMIVFMLQVLLLSIINYSVIGEQFSAIKFFTALTIESTMAPLLMGLMWKRLRYLGRSDTQKMFKTA